MSKKDFEKAANIAQVIARDADGRTGFPDAKQARSGATAVVEAFVELFRGEANGRFDEDRFRRACVPGANVRARG